MARVDDKDMIRFMEELSDLAGYWAPFALKGAADLARGVWIVTVGKRTEGSKSD